jgi:5-methylthioadenosine/S-adenosylhomocysteine deaminase
MIRFYNGRVLKLTGDMVPTDEEVWVEGELISYVGPGRPDAPAFEREIDLRGDLLMPGFKNAHAHSAMTFLRSMADDLPLREWLFERVFPLEARLKPEHVYAFTRLAILEYLSSGITAAFDMYYHADAIAQAGIDSGFRTVLCGAVSAGTPDKTRLAREYEKYNSLHPLVSYRLGFHAEYTADLPLLESIADLARAYKAPVWTHNAETREEVETCRERHGMTPTALFDSLGLFDYGGGGFHCIYLTEADIEIFRARASLGRDLPRFQL